MKKLRFLEILLLSQVERKARRVRFDPTATLIVGKNDTGKSTLIKSVFHTLGAEPVNHPKWKNAKVTALLKFAIDTEQYSILRYGNLFSVFAKSKELIGNFRSVTNELGPYLSLLLDFKLRLHNSQNQLVIPPPAYYLLPFYVDQDSGWSKNWNSFEKLGQIRDWRRKLIEYHTGIRPNEYYDLLAAIEDKKRDVETRSSEVRIRSNVLDKFDSRFKPAQFSIDIEEFKKEIEELLVHCASLKVKEDELRARLTDLTNIRIQLETQIRIVNNAKAEIKRDFDYAAHVLLDDEVSCPTCGASYENSFAERFSIAQDQNRCNELLLQLKNDLLDVNERISVLKEQFSRNTTETARIQELLDQKKSDVRLSELIESEGKKEVRKILKTEIDDEQSIINTEHDAIKVLKKALRKYDDDDGRRSDILKNYLIKMTGFLHQLDVFGLKEREVKDICTSVREIGSDRPRALLAYFYSILHVMTDYSSSVFCPVIIDSPNQQDQDKESLRKMMGFIVHNRKAEWQLILGTADWDSNLPFHGSVIELTDKMSLLSPEFFEDISDELREYLDRSLYWEQNQPALF